MHVKILYASLHQIFWRVTKACFWDDTVAAVWMLSWLLQIENCNDILFLELIYYVEFFDQTVT